LVGSVLFGLVVPGLLSAQGGAPMSVDRLVAAADRIIVGTVTQGTASGTAVALSIQVERVLKGSSAVGGVVAAVGTLSEPSQTRAIANERGIFFLSDSGTGPMRLVPAISGYVLDEMEMFVQLPASSAPAAQPARASPRDGVLLEVLGAIGAAPPKRPGGFVDVLAEYQANPTPAVRSVLQGWLASGSPALVRFSVYALLGEGNAAALAHVADDQYFRSSAVPTDAFDGLKFRFVNTDPNAVNVLGQLAGDTSNTMELRAAAATALARVHTKQALPFMAALWDSPDSTLRSCGVSGLSMFANNVPIGSHEPAAGEWRWRTEDTIAHSAMDASNAGFWKSWWVANQAALAQ
jgi:hypothetical protein